MFLKNSRPMQMKSIRAFILALGFLMLIVSFGAASSQKNSMTLIGGIQRSIGEGQTMGCEKIALRPKDVIRYFSTATEVSFSTFHYESIILPCAFSGKLRRNGMVYGWSINAAGAGYLYPEDGRENLFFLCYRSCAKALPGLMGL